MCFLFCAGGRRTRFLCETAAVVNDGDKPAKTEGREYSEGTPGHVQMPFPTHHQQRALQSVFLALCPPQSLPSAFPHHVLLLTPHLPFPRCQPFAGRQTPWETSSGFKPAQGSLPSSPASLLTPVSAPGVPKSLRFCSRGAGRLLLGGWRDTASHRHCTWSSKGTTTFLNFGFFWTNSILFTYLEERRSRVMSAAVAPALRK